MILQHTLYYITYHTYTFRNCTTHISTFFPTTKQPSSSCVSRIYLWEAHHPLFPSHPSSHLPISPVSSQRDALFLSPPTRTAVRARARKRCPLITRPLHCARSRSFRRASCIPVHARAAVSFENDDDDDDERLTLLQVQRGRVRVSALANFSMRALLLL